MKSKTLSIFKISATLCSLYFLGWETVRFQQDHTINFSMVDDQFGYWSLLILHLSIFVWKPEMEDGNGSTSISSYCWSLENGINWNHDWFYYTGQNRWLSGPRNHTTCRPTETMTSDLDSRSLSKLINLFLVWREWLTYITDYQFLILFLS